MPASSAHRPPHERGNRVRLKDMLQKGERERERELADELSMFIRLLLLVETN